MKNHFETLGLQEGASQEEIQSAYERLSKELYPAINDNQEFFVEEYNKVQEAYKALRNSTILKSSEKSYVNTTVDDSKSEIFQKQNTDSITITISPEKIEELKNKAQENKSNQYIKPSMFRIPFSFEGRIRRLEFGFSFIIWYFYHITILAIGQTSPVLYILAIPGIWFVWAQGAKRCHDLGNNGWWQIIPFYGLALFFMDGDIGHNEYGSNPKGINQIL